MNWTVPNTESLLRRLTKPKGKIDVVLDTDTYNELDDQFALSYMMKNSDKLNVKALYAAPFLNDKSVSPKDGMEKSYDEILKLLTLLKREDLKSVTFKGSETYLTDEDKPVLSPAAEDLAKRAMDYTPEKPLYVVAIGAITNVASALLLKPEIRDRIVLVWLGGNALHWPRVQYVSRYCGGTHCFRMRCGACTAAVRRRGLRLLRERAGVQRLLSRQKRAVRLFGTLCH